VCLGWGECLFLSSKTRFVHSLIKLFKFETHFAKVSQHPSKS
jgi:hypothetical protein